MRRTKRINRTAGYARRALVHADQHELVVAEVASGGQGHTVSHPLVDERVGLVEDPGALCG
jgi:hypothetical protein